MDTDSSSLLGSYDSEQEALRAVAAAAEKYGTDSDAVLNLVLFREDVPEDDAFVAEGAELVRQALSVTTADGPATLSANRSSPSGPVNGATNGAGQDAPARSRKASKSTS